MLAEGRLERVPPSREQADLLIEQAEAHIKSARAIAATDPAGGYAMAYDAARKALLAVLENQGLRPTSVGGHHAALGQSVTAQLVPPLATTFRPFQRMRRRRNSLEYPSSTEQRVTTQDVLDDAAKAEGIVHACARVLDEMLPY
jgi:hypothetical protein